MTVAPDDLDDALAGQMPAVVIDAVGNSTTVEVSLTRSAKNARVILLGMDEPQLRVPAYSVSVAERSIVGSFCYSRMDFMATARWVEEHSALVAPLIDAVEPLSAGPDIFTRLARREMNASKVLLSPNADRISAINDDETSANDA
jgi:threonine dehydrogenase-like Zn-dependent dehydrogenase